MTEPASTAASPAQSQFPQVAAVLVLFASDIDPGRTLRTILGVVGQVILVDNAPNGHPRAPEWLNAANVAVVTNANRGGLAGAYNTARRWLELHAPSIQYVTFIDDDSDATVLATFLADVGVGEVLARADTAAVAPAHRERATGLRARHLVLSRFGWQQQPQEAHGLQRVSFVINSMSVWRRAALDRIGEYDEWLGVDHVDTDYCLRSRKMGLKIYIHGDYEFAQSIGKRRKYRILGHELQSSGQSVERRRSIGRTLAWLGGRNLFNEPAFAALCAVRLIYEAVGITLAEQQAGRKLVALVRGALSGVCALITRTREGRTGSAFSS